MRQLARVHESLTTRHSARRRLAALLAAGLLAASGALIGSLPARADPEGGGGASESTDWGSDHDGVYEAQRGEIVCEQREACGGPAAVPMNRPGQWHSPEGAVRR